MVLQNHVDGFKMTRTTELYACLYVEELPLQALLRLRPELHDKPCVVLDGDPPLQMVCSLNTKARRLGASHAMTRVEIDTNTSIEVLQRSRNEEAVTKGVLLESVGVFSPRVEDQSEDGAFLCFIDILGTEKLSGSPEVLIRNLLTHIKKNGVTARVVVSRNANAAAALAKGLASRTALKIIAEGAEAAALAALPLSVLELTEEQRATFHLWGIHTLGMLADLPEKELIARMGQSGQRLSQLALGELPHPFQPKEPAFLLEEHMEFDSPVELLESVLFVVSGMLEQLIRRAESRALALAAIDITLTLEGSEMHTCTVRSSLPTNEKQIWINLLHLELRAHPPQHAIFSLAIKAKPGVINRTQLGIFTPQLPEPTMLDVTLARIRAVVGEGCVGRPVLIDTYQPQGFRIEPFAVPAAYMSSSSASQTRSALRRQRSAENIYVTVQDDRPKTFVFRHVSYTTRQAYGPWPVSGDWWSQASWRIEQWDLVASAQEGGDLLCCCVTHDLAQDRWQIAALHD
jgi:protein ImuB